MANALELHRQLKENSKKNTVIDMSDIQNITSRIRGEQNFAPLRNSTQNVPQNFNSNVSSNIMPKSFYNAGNQSTAKPLNNSVDTTEGSAFPMKVHKGEQTQLPTLEKTPTQQNVDELSDMGWKQQKAGFVSGLLSNDFALNVATAAMPADEGKAVRENLKNIANKYSEASQIDTSKYTQKELLDAYNSIPNYNIIE